MCNKLIRLFFIHFFFHKKNWMAFFSPVGEIVFRKHVYESIFKHFFGKSFKPNIFFFAVYVCVCVCALCIEWNRPWLLMACLKCSRHLFIYQHQSSANHFRCKKKRWRRRRRRWRNRRCNLFNMKKIRRKLWHWIFGGGGGICTERKWKSRDRLKCPINLRSSTQNMKRKKVGPRSTV